MHIAIHIIQEYVLHVFRKFFVSSRRLGPLIGMGEQWNVTMIIHACILLLFFLHMPYSRVRTNTRKLISSSNRAACEWQNKNEGQSDSRSIFAVWRSWGNNRLIASFLLTFDKPVFEYQSAESGLCDDREERREEGTSKTTVIQSRSITRQFVDSWTIIPDEKTRPGHQRSSTIIDAIFILDHIRTFVRLDILSMKRLILHLTRKLMCKFRLALLHYF